MILTIPQIAEHAYNNGFRGDAVAFAAAIGMAESSGNTEIVSGVVSDGTRGYGLMQIETENVQGGNWQDPDWQMQKAFAMSSQGHNFNAWCTACAPPMPGLIGGKGCGGYGSGAASKYLAAAYAAAAGLHVVPPAAPTGVSTWPGMDLRLLTPPIHGHGTGVWQARMNAIEGATLLPDGFYGPMTEYATTKYQRNHGLAPDGVVGKLTWDRGFATNR